MKTLITLFTLALLAVSCSRFRIKPKPYSTWKIDGVEYKSNDYWGTYDSAYDSTSGLCINNYNNRYVPYKPKVKLTFFNSLTLPTTGTFSISNEYKVGDVEVMLKIDSSLFFISNSDSHHLVADIKNGMPHYILPPSAFQKYVVYYIDNYTLPSYRWKRTDDSIIIEGEFYAPPMDE